MPGFHIVVFAVSTVEMRGLVAGDPEPIAVPIRTPGFSVEAHPAVLARLVVGVGDTVAFSERLPRTIHCNVASHCFDCADHFVSEYLRNAPLDFGAVSTPKMKVRTTNIRHTDSDEYVVRSDGWNWVFAKFHRCLCLCKDSNFSGFHFLNFPYGSVRRAWDMIFISVESSQTLFGTSRLGLVDMLCRMSRTAVEMLIVEQMNSLANTGTN